jgi:hypothetical protein
MSGPDDVEVAVERRVYIDGFDGHVEPGAASG